MRVFLIAALSADGFIARDTHELANWTSKEDKKLFVELTKRAGVFVMGSTTYRTLGRPLPGRKNIIYSRHNIADEGIEVTQESPQDLVERLTREGYSELAVCGGRAIYDMFLHAGVVNELYLTVEPVLFGRGITLASSLTDTALQLKECRQLNANTVSLHYTVQEV